MTHPANGLDDTVHQRVRLGILALLTPARACDFVFLRDQMEVTDGNLSRHLKVLEEAGYVRIRKGFVGTRPRTTVKITKEGRSALDEEVSALRHLISEIENGST